MTEFSLGVGVGKKLGYVDGKDGLVGGEGREERRQKGGEREGGV
jgi:hypothetical protein